MKIDITFLHPGGFNPRGLQGPFFPIGLVGLASLLEKRGFKPFIVNLLLEKILNPTLDYRKLIQQYSAPLFGIDLHWFVHSFEAIELAKLCKEVCPNSKIILGGITASQFDAEIMENFPFIDMIVRGDSELPVQKLLSHFINKDIFDFSGVPNLTYRAASGKIIKNTISYMVSQGDLDELDFLRFDFVLNWEEHLKLVNTDYLPLPNLKRTENLSEYYEKEMPKAWILYTGRGCPYKCSFCGGSSSAAERAFGRGLILRSPQKIAEDILRYNNANVDLLYFPHSPLIIPAKFHNQILDKVEERTSKLELGFIFEDSPFIIDFDIISRYLALFDGTKSVFRLYLADVEEAAARFNNFPVNVGRVTELIDFLRGKAYVMVGALIGLPGQTRESTLKMADFLKNAKEKGAIPIVYNAELHPGSELLLSPEKYNVVPALKNFMDYYNFLKNKKDKIMTYGYKTKNEIGLDEQRKILEEAIA